MRKVYEAFGERKREIIEFYNDTKAFDRHRLRREFMGSDEMVLVGKVRQFPVDSEVDIHWNINGYRQDKIKSSDDNGDIYIIEPLNSQIRNEKIKNIGETDTWFDGKIALSPRAIILMSMEKYDELKRNHRVQMAMSQMNIRVYEGDEELALRMIFLEKGFIFLGIDKNGYITDTINHPDVVEYFKTLQEKQLQIVDKLNMIGRNVTYGEWSGYFEKEIEHHEELGVSDDTEPSEPIRSIVKEPDIQKNENSGQNFEMITGLTEKVEGDIQMDDDIYATTDIGKIRENQEDAILLMKDVKNPKFRMMVLADGMGGMQRGEVASDAVVKILKKWFETLDEKQRACYFTGISGLKDSLVEKIEKDAQIEVEDKVGFGGTTLVCAIVGEKDTLIANIGDSRAYIAKDGVLTQVSREDTAAQENLEKEKTPTKEASRFDEESNVLLQCIGMDRNGMHHPHVRILDNNEYDMILLFSDGVTDCLSDEDIAVVCKTSNRKELTHKLVEKALRHDSIVPDEYADYDHLIKYIPGGKDNTSVVTYFAKYDDERE